MQEIQTGDFPVLPGCRFIVLGHSGTAKIYANEGVAQMLFLQSDEACEVSYKDRGGKYQGQRGVTLPKA